MTDELPILLFSGPAELEAWLQGNHAGCDGIWL
jgi:hypothetical protein